MGNKVALEAGNLAFIMALEIMERKGCHVLVLNSTKLPFIWNAPTKTNKENAMKLAHLIEERRDERLPLSSAAERKGTSKAESASLLREENAKPNKASEYAVRTLCASGTYDDSQKRYCHGSVEAVSS